MASDKILIIGPSWVGDMVMAQSLFKTLKRERPHCQIDVLAPQWSFPLLERMPEVSEGIPMPVGHGALELSTRKALGKSLQAKGYTEAIVLPNSLKSALVPFFAKIPKRTGWLGEVRYGLLNNRRKLVKPDFPLMIDRFNALAFTKSQVKSAKDFSAKHPIPELITNANDVNTAISEMALNRDKPVLALCPGAEFGEAKRWPAEHYATVAQQKLNEGWQVWLMGSAKDVEAGQAIVDLIQTKQQGDCHILAGKTRLDQAIDLLSVADAVVSNDSGLMHISAALHRPLVVVYGSSSPKFTPPLSDNTAIVQTDLECSPCFKRVCPLGHGDCLKKLSPNTVIESLAKLASNNTDEAINLAHPA